MFPFWVASTCNQRFLAVYLGRTSLLDCRAPTLFYPRSETKYKSRNYRTPFPVHWISPILKGAFWYQRHTQPAANSHSRKVMCQYKTLQPPWKKSPLSRITILNIIFKTAFFYDHSSILKLHWKGLQRPFSLAFHFVSINIQNRNSWHDSEFKTNSRIYMVTKGTAFGKGTETSNITYFALLTSIQ